MKSWLFNNYKAVINNQAVVTKLTENGNLGPDVLTGILYQTFKIELTHISFSNNFRTLKRKQTFKLVLQSQNYPDSKTR